MLVSRSWEEVANAYGLEVHGGELEESAEEGWYPHIGSSLGVRHIGGSGWRLVYVIEICGGKMWPCPRDSLKSRTPGVNLGCGSTWVAVRNLHMHVGGILLLW